MALNRTRVERVADSAHLLVDRSRYASARSLLDRLEPRVPARNDTISGAGDRAVSLRDNRR